MAFLDIVSVVFMPNRFNKLTSSRLPGARLGALIRSELSSLIFTKATRRKDVKHVANFKAPIVTAGDYMTVSDERPSDSVKVDADVDLAREEAAAELDDDDEKKSCQATINLVSE